MARQQTGWWRWWGCVVMVASWAGCDSSGLPRGATTPRGAEPAVMPVVVARPQRIEAAIESFLSYGRLAPRRQSQLGFGRGGRVAQVLKRIGQPADQGELLAELEQPELQQQRQRLQQSLERAERLAAGNPSANQPNAAQQQVAQLKLQLAELDAEISQGQIVAPYDCIVARRQIDVATEIAPGGLALSVIERAPPGVEVSLSRAEVESLRQPSILRVELEGAIYPASLEQLAPVENAVGGRQAWLKFEVDLPRDRWYFGRTVVVQGQSPTGQAGFQLPLTAMQRRAGELWSVFLAEPANDSGRHTVVRRAVRVVRTDGDAVIVQGSLDEQTLVIVRGTHRVVHGQQVTIAEVLEAGEFAATGGSR